ncbi:hypothetical protein LXA43DRAFT_555865 [Ganoderma leucocontextum]|nr:hypothetical protein LXA43DRAFT_555865 [Ganoderma leucocontextum]
MRPSTPDVRDESFHLPVEKPLWDRDERPRSGIGSQARYRRSPIPMSGHEGVPGLLMTHELWFDLDSQGCILLRVSIEGEVYELQLYFGCAFHSPKLAENDTVCVFIDKITPFILQGTSRPVLKSLMKQNTVGSMHYTAFFGYASANKKDEVQIPLGVVGVGQAPG